LTKLKKNLIFELAQKFLTFKNSKKLRKFEFQKRCKIKQEQQNKFRHNLVDRKKIDARKDSNIERSGLRLPKKYRKIIQDSNFVEQNHNFCSKNKKQSSNTKISAQFYLEFEK